MYSTSAYHKKPDKNKKREENSDFMTLRYQSHRLPQLKEYNSDARELFTLKISLQYTPKVSDNCARVSKWKTYGR